MNWNQIEGQWKVALGQAKSRWGKLTNDDLKTIAGKREQLVGKLQQRYGVLKDNAERQVDEWLATVTPMPGAADSTSKVEEVTK